MNNEISLHKLVESLFAELYAILDEEGADPNDSCYAIPGIETDMLKIIDGKLTSLADKRPFLERSLFVEPPPIMPFQFKNHIVTPRLIGMHLYWYMDGLYVGPVGTLCPELLNNAIAQQETYDDYKLPF